jgi:hypothetical protein
VADRSRWSDAAYVIAARGASREVLPVRGGAPPSSSQRSRALAAPSPDAGGVPSPSPVSPSARSPDRLGVFVISAVAKWPSDFPRTCLRRAGHSRCLVIVICSISRRSCFPSGDPTEDRVHVVVYSQGRPHSEDRLLANVWSKDYIRRREKVASRQLVSVTALTTPIKRLRKQNGQNREPY